MKRSAESQTMEMSSQLNPHAAPFVPASRPSFAESLNGWKDPEKQVGETEKHGSADESAGYDELPCLDGSLSLDDYAKSLGKIKTSVDRSSKREAAGILMDHPSQYDDGSDARNHFAVLETLSMMFPDVSPSFILEALKAHDYDTGDTAEMLFHLYESDGHGEPAEASGKQQQQQQAPPST